MRCRRWLHTDVDESFLLTWCIPRMRRMAPVQLEELGFLPISCSDSLRCHRRHRRTFRQITLWCSMARHHGCLVVALYIAVVWLLSRTAISLNSRSSIEPPCSPSLAWCVEWPTSHNGLLWQQGRLGLFRSIHRCTHTRSILIIP